MGVHTQAHTHKGGQPRPSQVAQRGQTPRGTATQHLSSPSLWRRPLQLLAGEGAQGWWEVGKGRSSSLSPSLSTAGSCQIPTFGRSQYPLPLTKEETEA